MKLKFYLRGLGIGILVTWLIMSVINHNKVEAAKEQVRAAYERQEIEWNFADNEEPSAAETDSSTEAAENESLTEEGSAEEPVIIRDGAEQPSDETGAAPEENQGEVSGDADEDADDNSGNAADDNNEDLQGENGLQNTGNAADENGDQEDAVVIVGSVNDRNSVEIVVAAGDDSGTVSRKLYNAGVVDNAAEFDAYLMQHGYDKRINKGTKVIYEDDSWQTIAEKLAGMQ